VYQLLSDPRLNHQCAIVAGLMADDCGQLLSAFFQEKRAQGKK
jgi:tRNA(adenine34) deaminase